MADLTSFVCLDTETGTFFCAGNAVLIDTRLLSSEELETLNEGTDTERLLLADKKGEAIALRFDS